MHDHPRYSRQTLVSEIGLDGQATLSKASVLIIGAGGLGCSVASLLSGAGVGKLTIVDFDTIDESNLHRQILYREHDIGLPKAEIAKRELQAINSSIDVMGVSHRLSATNTHTLCKNKSLVIDAADNFATSYLLSDACLSLGISLLSASVNRTFGHVGVFCNGAPSLRAVFPKLAKQQTNCNTVGVTGPSVGIIGSIQAQEALKILLGSASLLGKIMYLDLWNYSQHIIDVSSINEPESPQIDLISHTQILDSDWTVDVRSYDEIKNTPQDFFVHQNLELSNINALAREHDIERIVLACRSGQRALIAAQSLLDLGYTNLAVVVPE